MWKESTGARGEQLYSNIGWPHGHQNPPKIHQDVVRFPRPTPPPDNAISPESLGIPQFPSEETTHFHFPGIRKMKIRWEVVTFP